jgi:hypothetical protein
MEDKVYTNEDIEREVQERVAFKMNDVNDVINNHLRRCQMLMQDGRELRMEKMIREKVYKEVKVTFSKEINMPVPYDEMYIRKKGLQKDEAVDNVMDRFDRMTRGMRISNNQRHQFIKMLVNNIENTQR